MSEVEAAPDALADRIAARGRDALVARLRAAYAEAASAHADIVSIPEDRIEAMVQQAADSADGLQWRRALAEVAAEELGISLTEALSNPAVARAQELVGAPSYEDSLAELIASPVPGQNSHGAEPVAEAEPEAESEPEDAVAEEPGEAEPVAEAQESAPEAGGESEPEPEAEPEPEDAVAEELDEAEPVAEAQEPEVEPEPEAEPEPVAALEAAPEPHVHLEPAPTVEHPLPVDLSDEHGPGGEHSPPTETLEEVELVDGPALAAHDPEEDQLRVSAIHLGGVANLPVHEDGLDLRLSSSGLDIMHESDEIIGRLLWSEIEDLEVPATRGRLRRSRGRARLTVRTQHGDASFEVPAFTSDELRDVVDELLDRYGRY